MSEQVLAMTTQSTVRSIADLVADIARVLAPSLGAQALDEARDLLALMRDQPRHWSVLHGDRPVTATEITDARRAAEKRAAGAPLAYAVGRASFRHLMLHVDERVLIPRPETELLVEIVLSRTAGAHGGIAVDVGTGSGAIALALATEGAFARVIATDVSRDALDVARGNASRLGARVDFRQGSLLGPVPERGLCAVVSNPPYIAYEEAEALPASVRDWEPAVALYSGASGMDATARLVAEAAPALAPWGVLALEVDARRASTAAELVVAHGAFDDVQVMLDLTGRERFVVARRRLEEKG